MLSADQLPSPARKPPEVSGFAWFSLVAGEMIAGRHGLGYLINSSYTTTRYPTIVIAMVTLGVVGFASSAAVRLVGNRLIAWRAH